MRLNRRAIKQYFTDHPRAGQLLINVYNMRPFSNTFHGLRQNKIIIRGLLKKTKIKLLGAGNTVVIGRLAQLVDTSIVICGNNNKVIIGDGCYINQGKLYIEDSGGEINIGEKTSICGNTHIAVIEGCKVEIGRDCMFSADVVIRTGDSHSVIDNQTRERINQSKSVTIGNRVWVGYRAMIMKGVSVPAHSVIGAGAIVTKTELETNVVLAGNPAKIVKRQIDWDGRRL